jgi:hypothetical protein
MSTGLAVLKSPLMVSKPWHQTHLIVKGNMSHGHIDMHMVHKGSMTISNGTFTSGGRSIFSFLRGSFFGSISSGNGSNIIINGVPYVPGDKSHPSVSDNYKEGIKEFTFNSPIQIAQLETTTSAVVILERVKELLAGPHSARFNLSTSSSIQCQPSDHHTTYKIKAPIEIKATTSTAFHSSSNLHFHNMSANASTSTSIKDLVITGITLIKASTSATVSVNKLARSRVKAKESTSGHIRFIK